ncbi:putative arabinosyltransferase C domain protein [Mycobacterium xenopi 4042]|uniref:Putative arabinosyltransferase C domain protein n=1 Tax=Mycobacterium xenopi 4042 TaxID=1299334 RepID=X8DLK6_MYCXE|nr:putative arabinosyltransferase C domain protein [Mycobacterium xenopi 4042]
MQVPAVLRSAWYRLPPRDQAGPLLVVSAAGRFDPDEVQVQWAGEDGKPAGTTNFVDVGRRRRGETCARRWLRCPAAPPGCGWSPPTTT